MQTLLAVIEDLYTFVAGTLLGWQRSAPTQALPASRFGILTDEITVERDARAVREEAYTGEPAAAEKLEEPEVPKLLEERTVAYSTRAELPLRDAPGTNEPALGALAYGEMVMVLTPGMEWTYVATNGKKGYVPSAALARSATEVYPDFEIGKEYGPRDGATLRLRTFICDEFSAAPAELPLSAHEYAYYRVLRRGGRITWPEVRPRTPGAWAGILSTLESITVSGEPEGGAVMEYTLPDGRGHLAYVEEVYPDRSLKVSEADWPDRGIYNERVLVEEEWSALNPRFIVVG